MVQNFLESMKLNFSRFAALLFVGGPTVLKSDSLRCAIAQRSQILSIAYRQYYKGSGREEK